MSGVTWRGGVHRGSELKQFLQSADWPGWWRHFSSDWVGVWSQNSQIMASKNGHFRCFKLSNHLTCSLLAKLKNPPARLRLELAGRPCGGAGLGGDCH